MKIQNYYAYYVENYVKAVQGISATGPNGVQLSVDDALVRWCKIASRIKKRQSTCFFIGNGASASIASHFAADCLKNAHLRAQNFSDPALLTAIGNDLSADETFSLPLSRYGRRGDLLVTISSSGNSPNILRALATARIIGLKIVTLSAMSEQNRSRLLGDINLYIPSQRYGVAESAHALLLHCWLDLFLEKQKLTVL